MPEWVVIDWLMPVAIIIICFSLLALWRSIRLFSRLRLISASWRLCASIVFFVLGFAIGGLYLSTQNYRQLTHEQYAGELQIQPNGRDRFVAHLVLTGGQHISAPLYGDQVQLSAYIVKWKPWLSALGFNTLYRLDRISGRFSQVQTAMAAQFSAHPINPDSKADIASWRKQYQCLSVLVDLEQGSAAYVAADKPIRYDVYISVDAVLLRASQTVK